MALAVPLSRFTSRVGGGSAFFVRPIMRIVMSLLRIVFGVLLGIGIMFVAIPYLFKWFPGIMAFIFFGLFAALVVWKIVHSLRTDTMAINARGSMVYGRYSFGFWFYIFFFGFLGVLSLCAGIYCLCHLPLLALK